MNSIELKIKKLHSEAVIPQYAKPGDAGLDLVAISEEWNEDNTMVTYGTGLAIEIPEGHVGLIFPRSSISKTTLNLSNSVGVIDSGYRGPIMFKFRYLECVWCEGAGKNLVRMSLGFSVVFTPPICTFPAR